MGGQRREARHDSESPGIKTKALEGSRAPQGSLMIIPSRPPIPHWNPDTSSYDELSRKFHSVSGEGNENHGVNGAGMR